MTGSRIRTTVTFLTTSALPAALPVKPAGIELTVMRATDIPTDYYRYLYRAVGAKWLWFERLLLDDAQLSQKIHAECTAVYVLYAGGSPAGYFEIDFSGGGRAGLCYFGLAPTWTGRGIGPWLLGEAIREGFSRGASTLAVNTCTLDHPAALPLYQRMGFRIVRRETRDFAVPDGVAIPDHVAARRAG